MVAGSVAAGVTAENEVFMRSLDGLSSDERQYRIEHRQDVRKRLYDDLVAERRHRELVDASRAKSSGLLGAGILGFIIGSAT